ncbi:DUF2798 domain-containing protein [Chachezhania sediminis]|uniref:DUF2798 domain-containing protein n=1 Tax=Chachezhania sediminis TaxID=2599291 RepID=UPI001E566401|nr:DUF2798 domain-containing protein [Chachezhania sediminis]
MTQPNAQKKKTIIVAQFLISMMMAFLMTLIFTSVPTGFAAGWVGTWLSRLITAWPVAFVLSLGLGPLAFIWPAWSSAARSHWTDKKGGRPGPPDLAFIPCRSPQAVVPSLACRAARRRAKSSPAW